MLALVVPNFKRTHRRIGRQANIRTHIRRNGVLSWLLFQTRFAQLYESMKVFRSLLDSTKYDRFFTCIPLFVWSTWHPSFRCGSRMYLCTSTYLIMRIHWMLQRNLKPINSSYNPSTDELPRLLLLCKTTYRYSASEMYRKNAIHASYISIWKCCRMFWMFWNTFTYLKYISIIVINP